MSATTKLLEKAIQFSKTGRKEDARCLLLGVLRFEPENEAVWFLYVNTFEDRVDRIAALETFLKRAPHNTNALAALQKLLAEPVHPNQKKKSLAISKPKSKSTPQNSKVSRIPFFLVTLGVLFFVIGGVWIAFRLYAGFEEGYLAMAVERNTLQRDLVTLQNDFTILRQVHSKLLNEFEDLNTQYNQLGLDYRNLLNQYNQLGLDHSNLMNQYDHLNQEYVLLNDAYHQLSETYNQLSYDYADLEEKSIQPPYIFIHDRKVELSFYRSNGTIWRWSTYFEGLESNILRGDETRKHMPIEYAITDQGERISVYDYTIFVDPEPFTDVIDTLYRDSTSPDAFIREVWQIVTQLSHWTEEEGEIPRYPFETLLAGGGDCEDLSILLASLIRAAPVNWRIDLVYIDTDNLTDPQKADHVIVHLYTGEREYYIETTNDEVMEPYTNGVTGWFYEIK